MPTPSIPPPFAAPDFPGAEPGVPPRRVAVLADSDTRWKWGVLTARRLAPGARIDGLLLRGRATPTPRQLAEVGITVDSLREVTTAEFVRAVSTPPPDADGGVLGGAVDAGGVLGEGDGGSVGVGGVLGEGGSVGAGGVHGDASAGAGAYEMVVLSCVGGAVQAMLHGLKRAGEQAGVRVGGRPGRVVRDATVPDGGERGGVRRPVVVTGYVGVVYEKLTDGLLLRHGADLVLANSPYDAERFRAVYKGVGADSGGVVECALPFLDAAATDDSDECRDRDRRFTVIFAVQPSVPHSRQDRAYLLGRALAHARRHPQRDVLIKLRSKPGEHTTHIEEEPYQKLLHKLPGADTDGGLPPNFRLVYGNMGRILDSARRTGGLLVTVSSTAALESLHRSVPTAVLTDLGVRETLGNHYFIGSGCLASWDQLDDGLLPEADEEWVRSQGVRRQDVCNPGTFAAARERVAQLTGRASRSDLPPLAPYYTARTAPGYQPGTLRRYGLDPSGALLDTAARDSEDPGVVRRALREAARGAYRHGVQRVAPLIRKAGQL